MPKNGRIIGVSDHGGCKVLVTVARDRTLLDRHREASGLALDNVTMVPHFLGVAVRVSGVLYTQQLARALWYITQSATFCARLKNTRPPYPKIGCHYNSVVRRCTSRGAITAARC
jgi:hypothetical protein